MISKNNWEKCNTKCPNCNSTNTVKRYVPFATYIIFGDGRPYTRYCIDCGSYSGNDNPAAEEDLAN